MRGKIYTTDELNRALPLVRAIVKDIVDGYRRLRKELEASGVERRHISLGSDELMRRLPRATRDLVDEVRGVIDELGELGIFLRDPEKGLIEAYGQHDGEIVYYSWKPGEARVEYWHGLFASSTERRTLPALVS